MSTRQWAFDHRSLYTTLMFDGRDLCRLVSGLALVGLEWLLKDGSVEDDRVFPNNGT